MALDQLWSMSTTIRNANRIPGFLKTAVEMDGREWNNNSQIEFQIRLIKNREYLNHDQTQTYNKLSEYQIKILRNKEYKMSMDEAADIFKAKQYNDPAMRGRQSMSPLIKLGLVYYKKENNKKFIKISKNGKILNNDPNKIFEIIVDSLLKYQYPNPSENSYNDWNSKPFINVLRLIKEVNNQEINNRNKPKGISFLEFGIFALSLKRYDEVEKIACKLLEFRNKYNKLSYSEREEFTEQYIEDYLSDFKNPVKNVREYTDNMVRYIRLTKYVFIRGKYDNKYIDLEPRRMLEIDTILEKDNGKAQLYTEEEWNRYMGDSTYELPFETIDKLKAIAENVVDEVNTLSENLNQQFIATVIPNEKEELKKYIEINRQIRTRLQNDYLREIYHNDISKIDEAIEALGYITSRDKSKLVKKPSIELEKWTSVALNILDDCKNISPNTIVGDDNEPIFTAPSGVADIECYYKQFNAICEVTMLTNRDQWHNEGQPVQRHLREFELKNNILPSYCLFIAPKIHVDTVNTFYMAVKYEYEGSPLKIIPITIKQLQYIVETVKLLKDKNIKLLHTDIKALYDSCINLKNVPNSKIWLSHIERTIIAWRKEICANNK